MTVPKDTPITEEPMDPADVRKFGMTITRPGDEDFPMLEAGEDFASYSLSPSIEAQGLGMSILSTTGYAPNRVGDRVDYYPMISDPQKNATVFSGEGIKLAVEFTGVKDTNPPQTIQRSVGLWVLQQ